MDQSALDLDVTDDGERTYSVSELADAINDRLRSGFPGGVWVRGEIDSLRNSGPHTYLTLVESVDGVRAQLNVSLFAPAKKAIRPVLERHRLELVAGTTVRVFGQLDYYAPGARLGLKMTGIDPNFTLGALSQARDEVLRRLVASGLVDANRGRPLGPVPIRVGLVTSKGSAAWHDFIHELESSGLGFGVVAVDTAVQGTGAERSVAAAIRTLGARSDLDCIAVIRGGGSRNDLSTFDAEVIALAIARCPLPVFTGLGHEIDRSIADEVAHRALKTPTACAGALVDLVAGALDRAEASWSGIVRAADRQLTSTRAALGERAHRIAVRTLGAVERADERLERRCERLGSVPLDRLRQAEEHLASSTELLRSRTGRRFADEERALADRAARLGLLDPVNLLRRGWSITRTADGRIVSSTADAPSGSVITTQVADGHLTSRIEEP